MRGKQAKQKIVSPDPIYGSAIVTQLINRVMKDGKKSAAQKQVYQALELLKKKAKKETLAFFDEALENIRPKLEVRPRRVGGAAYQIPMPVRGERRNALAIRWLILAARSRPNKECHHFSEKLAAEILDACKNEGGAVKKKENIHRMAEANKAFAHFRW